MVMVGGAIQIPNFAFFCFLGLRKLNTNKKFFFFNLETRRINAR